MRVRGAARASSRQRAADKGQRSTATGSSSLALPCVCAGGLAWGQRPSPAGGREACEQAVAAARVGRHVRSTWGCAAASERQGTHLGLPARRWVGLRLRGPMTKLGARGSRLHDVDWPSTSVPGSSDPGSRPCGKPVGYCGWWGSLSGLFRSGCGGACKELCPAACDAGISADGPEAATSRQRGRRCCWLWRSS